MNIKRFTVSFTALVLITISLSGPVMAQSQVTLEPPFQSLDVGLTAELAGEVMDEDGTPVTGQTVQIEVISGPNAGLQSVAFTDFQGRFAFSYISNVAGLDRLEATAGSQPSAATRALSPAATATAEVEWLVDEPPAPDCNTVVASPRLIWPPNHKFHAVTLYGPEPVDGVEADVTVTHVHQDEPVNYLGDGNFEPDAEIGEQGQSVAVRAERSGLLDGRLYFIGFTAELPAGGACEGQVALGVPHDRRQNNLPQDSGERYDSLTGDQLSGH